jgi:hypothetical protein
VEASSIANTTNGAICCFAQLRHFRPHSPLLAWIRTRKLLGKYAGDLIRGVQANCRQLGSQRILIAMPFATEDSFCNSRLVNPGEEPNLATVGCRSVWSRPGTPI